MYHFHSAHRNLCYVLGLPVFKHRLTKTCVLQYKIFRWKLLEVKRKCQIFHSASSEELALWPIALKFKNILEAWMNQVLLYYTVYPRQLGIFLHHRSHIYNLLYQRCNQSLPTTRFAWTTSWKCCPVKCFKNATQAVCMFSTRAWMN